MRAVERLPEVLIEIDGVPLTGEELAQLVHLRVEQALSRPTQCEMIFTLPASTRPASTLSNSSGRMAARWQPGDSLRIAFRSQKPALFNGQLTAKGFRYGADGEAQLILRGYDRMHTLRKRQHVRAYIQTTPAEVCQELSADLGLRVVATETGALHTQLVQHEQSDFDFLCELLEKSGIYFFLEEKTLHLCTLDGIGESEPLKLGDSLLEAEIELNSDSIRRQISASAWNPQTSKLAIGRAAYAHSGHRVAAALAPAAVGAAEERWVLDDASFNEPQLAAVAQSAIDRAAAREIFFWGVAQGNSALHPAVGVELEGVETTLNGHYVLTHVVHTMSAEHGYLSELSNLPPEPQARTKGAVATLAIVSQVSDPDQLGRVRVILPAYNNVESEWLQVVAAAAGVNKGLVALPDKGDNVLVLLTHHNPARGIVLGGLYAPAMPYDSGVEDNAIRRYSLRTPGGNLIQMDDKQRQLRIENSLGSYLELTPGKVRLYAATDLELSAPGQSIVIRSSKIDFETT